MSTVSPKKSYLVVKIIAMILLASIVALAILRDRFVANPMWQVSVPGRGEITYTPDMAKINIGVKVERIFSAEEALKQLNASMDRVIKAVKDTSVEAKDIQTLSYNLYPQYNYNSESGASTLAGYNAEQQLVVTVNDLSGDLLNKVVSASTKSGANQINSINFDSTRMEALKQEARLKAIGDAKSKADELSGAAGVKLGKVIGWWENVVQGPDMYGYYGKGGAMPEAGGPVTMPSGEYKLILEVNLNYEVK